MTLSIAGCGKESVPDTHLASLSDISIEALRARDYGSVLQPVLELSVSDAREAYLREFSADGTPPYASYIAEYDSDGNRIFTRIDIPSTAPPEIGYPALIFVHGWYGREGARAYDFLYTPDSPSSRFIDAFVDDGFLVLSPALRGHGTVNGKPADGLEFLDAWDNGSYISPMFYAIDVLNLLEGLASLEDIDWNHWGLEHEVRIDPDRVNIAGHSQGGDAVLAALAVSGEGSGIGTPFRAGSIWSGCFGPRLEQAAIYGPMTSTLEAFMSGDGLWTGTPTGHDGSVNPNFVFGYPPDWIGTVNPHSSEWTWQAETWTIPTVAEALHRKFSEMYEAVNRQVADIDDAEFSIFTDDKGAAAVRHDPRIEEGMRRIGGYQYERFLTEPIHLHHSDQDYYSIPRWNADLASRINTVGGNAVDFVYPQNNHSLLVSEYDWFSSGEVIEGFSYMIERDLALFSRGGNPVAATADEDRVSIKALQRYAATMRNEFETEYEREPLEGIERRVVNFTADGLKQYALILQPAGQPPENGWPVLMMNHGYHPNPPDNGRTADGKSDRPGDYYRGLPLAYAKRGFLVVVPDYRGHNISEGFEYTRRADAPAWYARDVIAAFRALGSLPDADLSNAFMWGHSMGGGITVRALQALGSDVRGASIWSTSMGPGDIGEPIDLTELETPLIIHHSTGDPTAPFQWSDSAFRIRKNAGLTVEFYPYEGDDHLFRSQSLRDAIRRDSEFFLAHVSQVQAN